VATGGGTLLGRRQECAALDEVAADVRAGMSRVLVLRGDAGVGKSALLRYFSDQVASWHVISAVGVESEMELAYSGLHQVCAPLLGRLGDLPPPQRDALSVVFGLDEGPPPDRFLVGLAALTLLAESSELSPLACLVDDGQWLDQATAQVLGFVARRLLAEQVAIVCAARPADNGADPLSALPQLAVTGLRNDDARALLLSGVHAPVDADIVDQVLAESEGNPLALIELPRTWSATYLAVGLGVPDRKPVRGRIESSYVARLTPLPRETQLLVLAAAAEPLGDPVLLSRAATALGIDLSAVVPATDAGLVQVGDRVQFTHPLVRSAVYRAATTDDRHRVHSALASATDPATDPDRRAWHLARATPALDETVATELERSAGRAQARGGFAAAAAFLGRATQLTPDPATRVRRALDAAFTNVQVGSFDMARRLLGVAEYGPVDLMQRARIDLLNGHLALMSNRGNEATPLLLTAARGLEPLQPEVARETYLDAFTAALFGARLNEEIGVRDVAAAAQQSPRRQEDEETPAGLLLDAFCALAEGYEGAVPKCRRTLDTLAAGRDSLSRERLRWLWHGAVLGLEVWDDGKADFLSEAHVEIARATGALSELALALSARTPVLVFRGQLAAAASAVDESAWLEEATGLRAAPYGALLLTAWRGDEPGPTKDLVRATVEAATSRGEGIGITVSEYAHALLCNALGEYEEAVLAATVATEDPTELVAYNWGLPELVEAASRAGDVDRAEEALGRLTRKARATGTDWALGLAARSRALVGAGDDAAFREAIHRLGRTGVRAELARAHLLYGEWLRRGNRRVAARAELTTAHALVTGMGMAAFAERTGQELLATGATVRKRGVHTQGDLTAQEVHIARLARSGLSNPEIASQLFLSARTVEWHLRKVFLKLGISSRRQLRAALSDHGLLAAES
jgi:DNA-binding CsgD family transcriptional regulator